MFKIRHERNLSEDIGGFSMKELNLPVIKKPAFKQKTLSMDEYLKFVRFHLEYTFDKNAYAKWKKMLVVNVPFSII